MDKRSLDLLEKAFDAEVSSAVCGGLGIIQSTSKAAKKLEEGGYLEKVSINLNGRFPVVVTGYVLTHAGHLAYFTSDRCSGEPD